jgi:hypothetical protein
VTGRTVLNRLKVVTNGYSHWFFRLSLQGTSVARKQDRAMRQPYMKSEQGFDKCDSVLTTLTECTRVSRVSGDFFCASSCTKFRERIYLQ